MRPSPDIEEFRLDARRWLEANAAQKSATPGDSGDDFDWGVGSDNVAVFFDLTEAEERQRLEACRDWQRRKFDAGYAMLNWPEDDGGRGLPGSYARTYSTEESRFVC